MSVSALVCDVWEIILNETGRAREWLFSEYESLQKLCSSHCIFLFPLKMFGLISILGFAQDTADADLGVCTYMLHIYNATLVYKNLCEQQEFVISNKIFYVASFPFFSREFLRFFPPLGSDSRESLGLFLFPAIAVVSPFATAHWERRAGQSWNTVCCLTENFWHQ